MAKRFPVAPFIDSTFLLYLHRFVFWSQLKTTALELLPSLLEEVRCSVSTPSLSLSQYIDSSRARQWKYAISEQIKSREINKSVDWKSPKNVHGEGAMRHLIYRYWLHVLLKEGVALEESPNFVDWCDLESDGFMFTAKQEESWTIDHLKLCHWYVEMPKDETPLHEEQNRRAADPSFSWSNVASASRATNADFAPA